MDNQLFNRVDQYIADLLAPEDEAMKECTHALEAAGIPQMSVSANQGKMLQVLAKMAGARKILELGTLAGYSTIWMARALPLDGKLITLEFDPLHAAVAKDNIERAGLAALVDIRVGAALEILPSLQEEAPFDMIFIDADKPPYTEYFRWAVDLSRKGTIIVADNVVREGKVLDPDSTDDKVQGVRRFNAMLAENPDVTATIIQTVGAKEHDGMAMAVVN